MAPWPPVLRAAKFQVPVHLGLVGLEAEQGEGGQYPLDWKLAEERVESESHSARP